jgi:Xaa-Pro aminopeptidase
VKAFDLRAARAALAEEGLDGWLFYFFQDNDPIARRVLGVPPGKFFTRRWFYLVPRRGAPVKVVHRIEPDALDFLPGGRREYLSHLELRSVLASVLRGRRRVAMQYSSGNALPYISRVDAGTVESVRACGARVVTSADLVQRLEAPLTAAQARQHFRTAGHLRDIVFGAFGFVRDRVLGGRPVREHDVQRHIAAAYARRGLVSNSPPIVAVNRHSASPHYVPTLKTSAPVRRGDWLLLDIWAKPRGPDAVYADITWCGSVGHRVPSRYENIFQIVRGARDAALALVRREAERGRSPRGWEVDRAARGYIERKGYGKYFIHRTGHSIGTEDHANGANLDGLETRETRRLLPHTLFSIEPGIYLKEFGVRSEIDVYLDGRRAVVSGGPAQERVVPILAR